MKGIRRALSDITYRAARLTGTANAGLRMLMYHRVTDAHPTERLCVPVKVFAEQMRYLSEAGYRTVSFGEAVDFAARRRALAPSSVVLTFDDGFEDNALFAVPAMEKFGFKGCFFVPSAFIESGPSQHPPEDRPMSWEQLARLIAGGHEIGGHSVTHRKLTLMPVDEAAWEVRTCKESIERSLRKPVEWFCYPAGAYNGAIKRAVAESGYRGACSVRPGAIHQGADPFSLTRTEISGFDSVGDFEKKLAGAYDWMHAAVQLAQRFKRPRECANAMARPQP